MTTSSDIRPAAVAGRFYPDAPGDLRGMVDSFLAEAACPTTARAHGVVVPHAGLQYSGACAAHVFASVEWPELVVIIGPNHTGVVPVRGRASVWVDGGFDTPLGLVSVAGELAEALCDTCPDAVPDHTAHAYEHAIEVELPFLRVVQPSAQIVPIVVNSDSWEASRSIAEALANLIRAWPEPVALVASSDMSHYEDAMSAERKDRMALEQITSLNGEGLLATCRRYRITMCGRAPTAVMLETVRLLGAEQVDIVDYRNSGWVTGDNANVVGYAGVVVR